MSLKHTHENTLEVTTRADNGKQYQILMMDLEEKMTKKGTTQECNEVY